MTCEERTGRNGGQIREFLFPHIEFHKFPKSRMKMTDLTF